MSKKFYLKSPIRLLFAFISVILMSIGFMLLFQNPSSGNSIPEYSTIIISKGDTLWAIAKRYNFDNQDLRSKINEIKEINGINSTIKVGQELKIKIK